MLKYYTLLFIIYLLKVVAALHSHRRLNSKWQKLTLVCNTLDLNGILSKYDEIH